MRRQRGSERQQSEATARFWAATVKSWVNNSPQEFCDISRFTRFDYPVYNSAIYTIRFKLCKYIYNWVTLWGGFLTGFLGSLNDIMAGGVTCPERYSCTAIWVGNHLEDKPNSTGDVGYHSKSSICCCGS